MIPRSLYDTAVDRNVHSTPDEVEYRDDSGNIDPFFDEDEDEEYGAWEKVDLGGFPRGFDLVGVCLRVVWKDKEILAFQAASITLVVSFLIIFMSLITRGFDQEFLATLNPVIVVFQLFPYYVLASFIGTYFSAATVAVATIRMKGGNPTFADGLEAATRKSPSILGWAVISAVVGTFIALLRSQKRGSRVAADVVQLAWGVATYFVIPVMLFEGEGPLSAIDRSTSIMKRTWKESLAGNLGMGLIFLILVVLGLLISYPIGFALGGLLGGILAALISIIVVLVFSSAANGVLVAALYRLARTGKAPAGMDGYNYQEFGSVFGGLDRRTAGDDAFLTADELTEKYAR